ncbi:MAG: methyltransferase domain-containing protein, partial [Ignavibacteriales bacterium]|nr:methyltransferase domain-containing protein [Ignavibacteriales bacterium]
KNIKKVFTVLQTRIKNVQKFPQKYFRKNSKIEYKNSCEIAIRWLKNNQLENGGIITSSKQRTPYPEVTGYIIPTLCQWGEKGFAGDLTNWLIHHQNNDGSFSAPDGIPYTFDTGQVIRGFVAELDNLPEVEKPLRKACDWILTQVQLDGRLATPSTKMWGKIADDRIHIYVLSSLIKAGEKLNERKYIDAAQRILEYYKKKKELIEFNTLSHFYAYIIEALCDLDEKELAKEGMGQIATLQRKNGSIPAYKDVSWVCSPGLAQFAVIWYKLGMREYADKAMNYLEKIQNKCGGFYGSYGKEANYFPKEEISWAVKFFLDAYYWKIKTSFNQEVNIFPESIDENDGRVQEILTFFGNLNGKKIIDVGCGKGRFFRILKNKFSKSDLYGLDVSEKMLSFCPKEIKTVCGSILDIRYPDKYFDYVYCVETLEHSLRIENAIKEMVRILKPAGKIIIIDKNIAKVGVLKLESWEHWFEPKEIVNLLQKYGVKTCYKPITYEKHSQPDGLFIAWEGIKNDKYLIQS